MTNNKHLSEEYNDGFQEGIKEANDLNSINVKKLEEEFKIIKESADFDSYDLSDKKEEWKSGFRRAMLLVNNCIDIYKFHSNKIFGIFETHDANDSGGEQK